MPFNKFGFGDPTGKGSNDNDAEKGLEGDVKPGFGDHGNYNDFSPSPDAAECGALRRHTTTARNMSRIDRPRTKSISASVAGRQMTDSDSDDNTVSIAKQMELEAGNEIQYRTCTWQKVCIFPSDC